MKRLSKPTCQLVAWNYCCLVINYFLIFSILANEWCGTSLFNVDRFSSTWVARPVFPVPKVCKLCYVLTITWEALIIHHAQLLDYRSISINRTQNIVRILFCHTMQPCSIAKNVRYLKALWNYTRLSSYSDVIIPFWIGRYMLFAGTDENRIQSCLNPAIAAHRWIFCVNIWSTSQHFVWISPMIRRVDIIFMWGILYFVPKVVCNSAQYGLLVCCYAWKLKNVCAIWSPSSTSNRFPLSLKTSSETSSWPRIHHIIVLSRTWSESRWHVCHDKYCCSPLHW